MCRETHGDWKLGHVLSLYAKRPVILFLSVWGVSLPTKRTCGLPLSNQVSSFWFSWCSLIVAYSAIQKPRRNYCWVGPQGFLSLPSYYATSSPLFFPIYIYNAAFPPCGVFGWVEAAAWSHWMASRSRYFWSEENKIIISIRKTALALSSSFGNWMLE